MAARVIGINGQQGDLDRIKEAARIVEDGGLVAFPTETVYGIACRVHPAALARLDRIKGRDASKHYTVHIGQIDEYRKYVQGIGIQTEKLIRHAWPGPLTLVFNPAPAQLAEHRNRLGCDVADTIYKDGSVGIRCPDHPVASLLLRLVDAPVIAPSANRAGRPPAAEAAGVVAELSDDLDVILDGGACKLGKSSTVATVGHDGIQVLREIKMHFPRVQVLMLTGHADMEVAISGMAMGAFDYLMKPVELNVLVGKIQAACSRNRKVGEGSGMG